MKPHGYHLMLEKLNGPLQEGEIIPLTLQFDGAEALEVELMVKPLDDGSMKEKMDHSDHHME